MAAIPRSRFSPAWCSPEPRLPADAYQLIGGGGDAVMLIGLFGPDIVAVRIGPNRPHPPNSGTVTVVLIAKPPVTSAFTGSEMLNGSWIGSTVVQPIGTWKNPMPTEPTSSFAAPFALSLKTALLVRPTVPWIVPVGVRAPLTVIGMPSTEMVWLIGGIDRFAVSAPVVTSPWALSVAPFGTSTEMPLLASVTEPVSCHAGSGMTRSPVMGVRRAVDGSVALGECCPHVLGAVLPASRSSTHLITVGIAVGSVSR